MSQPVAPRRKRSATLTLTTMAAGASLTVAACDQAPPAAQWDAPRAGGEPVPAFSYASLEQCKVADEIPDAECDAGYAAAQADDNASAPRFDERASCEEVYGAGNCVPRNHGGGSFFTPFLTGFVVAQLLDGGGRPYYRGTGLYRRDDRYGGGYYSGWGGYLDRDYRTGRTVISRQGVEPPASVRQAPPKVQTRTTVVSRGGFGGGRSYGG